MRINVVAIAIGLCIIEISTAGDALAETGTSTQDSQPVASQQASSQAALSSAPPEAVLEEVVVSAQRRAENIQDVPLSVIAVSADSLAARGVIDTASLNGLVPSLSVTPNGQTNVFFLRGIGSPVVGANGEQSVAMYEDGVYIYAPIHNKFPIGDDIDHVEVLEGPQGTLFGRNSTAGVIQFITKDPNQQPGSEVTVGYGNYQTSTVSLYATTGITDDLAADISIYSQNMGKGFGKNLFNGLQNYQDDQYIVKSKWLWTPGDSTQIRVTGTFIRQTSPGDGVQAPEGSLVLNGTVSTVGPFNVNTDWPWNYSDDMYIGAIQIDHDFGFGKLESITSYQRVTNTDFNFDEDLTPQPLLNVKYESPDNVVTQELRLLSPNDSSVKWVAGLYYILANTGFEPLTVGGTLISPLPGVRLNEVDTQKMWALAPYGQTTFKVAKDTNLTLGVRYNYEDQSSPGTSVEASPGIPAVPAGPFERKTYRNVSWRGSLDHKWTPDLMSYASVTRSFKSGGFNLASAPGTSVPPYLPERVTAYELGEKSEFFQRKLRLNIAAYVYDYLDVQVESSTVGGILTTNGPSAYYKGIEAELEASLSQHLSVSGGINYVEGEYGKYLDALGYTGNPAQAPIIFNATGFTTVYTPRWSGTANIDYLIPSGVGDFAMNANVSYSDMRYVSVLNRLTIPSYVIPNASLKWTPKSRPLLDVKLWVLNAFNHDYVSNRLEASTGDWQYWAPPRTYGVSFSLRFGRQN